MKKLSICIPTYNRSEYLNNCLNSIFLNNINLSEIDICISDNNSTDNTSEVVIAYENKLNIKYIKNTKNIGVAQNILKVVGLSDSEFCWIIGDDDLLLNDGVKTVLKLLNQYKGTDYFYINSYNLNKQVLKNHKFPINPSLIKEKMYRFSNNFNDFDCNFIDLIDPKISFDYLGGLYLSVFKKSKWDENVFRIDKKKIENKLLFSNLENTFPHVKIFSYAFKDSKAFYYSRPLTINLHGKREWTSLYPIIRSIRIINSLDLYFANGLPFIKYLKFKNQSLQYFIPDLIKMILNLKNSYPYLLEFAIFYIRNFYYPNLYLSAIYQLKRIINKI